VISKYETVIHDRSPRRVVYSTFNSQFKLNIV